METKSASLSAYLQKNPVRILIILLIVIISITVLIINYLSYNRLNNKLNEVETSVHNLQSDTQSLNNQLLQMRRPKTSKKNQQFPASNPQTNSDNQNLDPIPGTPVLN